MGATGNPDSQRQWEAQKQREKNKGAEFLSEGGQNRELRAKQCVFPDSLDPYLNLLP